MSTPTVHVPSPIQLPVGGGGGGGVGVVPSSAPGEDGTDGAGPPGHLGDRSLRIPADVVRHTATGDS